MFDPDFLTPIEVFGTIGTTVLALCSVPQVIECIRLGKTGMNGHMAITWFIGVVMMFIYTAIKTGDVIICANYAASIVFSSIITYYKYFPREINE